MPPGYGCLTRHLCTRQLTLGEMVQIADRRVLVLEMRKKHGSAPKIHTCSGPDSRDEQNTGTQGAITNRTLVPPPQVRTTPHDRGACGAIEGRQMARRRLLQQQRQRPPLRVAELQRRWPQGGRRCNLALAYADARGARTSTKSRRPGVRMVTVIPLATGTSRAASTSAPTTRSRLPTSRSPLGSSQTNGAPTSARRRRTRAKAGQPQNTNAALAARDVLGGPPVRVARQPPLRREGAPGAKPASPTR
jgi:hypothetical protein